MRTYLVLFITGPSHGVKKRITIPNYYRNNQAVWIDGDRARILEVVA